MKKCILWCKCKIFSKIRPELLVSKDSVAYLYLFLSTYRH